MSRNILTFTVNKNKTFTENLSRCSCLGHSVEVISPKKKVYQPTIIIDNVVSSVSFFFLYTYK